MYGSTIDNTIAIPTIKYTPDPKATKILDPAMKRLDADVMSINT